MVEKKIAKALPRYISAVVTVSGSPSPFDDKYKMKAVVRSVAKRLKLPLKNASVSRSFISGRLRGHVRIGEWPMDKEKKKLLRQAATMLSKKISVIDWESTPFLEQARLVYPCR